MRRNREADPEKKDLEKPVTAGRKESSGKGGKGKGSADRFQA